MRWHFHYPVHWSWSPSDYARSRLGGCENALIRLARGLTWRKHEVVVFTNCARSIDRYGVQWAPIDEPRPSGLPDVDVAVRYREALQYVQTERSIFWMLDEKIAGPAAFASHPSESRAIVTASWSMQHRLVSLGRAIKIVQIPLPVAPAMNERAERRKACLFSSVPSRGLDVVFEIWPDIVRQVPDARLWVTWREEPPGPTRDAESAFLARLTAALPPAVTIYGPVSRPELVRLQASAWMVLYPCRFSEMFCLSVAEAAALATPAIASGVHALRERILNNRTGVLIDGSIDDPRTRREFVEHSVSLLRDSRRRDALGAAAQAEARRFHSDVVATLWERAAGLLGSFEERHLGERAV